MFPPNSFGHPFITPLKRLQLKEAYDPQPEYKRYLFITGCTRLVIFHVWYVTSGEVAISIEHNEYAFGDEPLISLSFQHKERISAHI